MAGNFGSRTGGARISSEIKGLDELLATMRGGKLLPGPARRFLDRLGIKVEGLAKGLTPVDRGKLRAEISHEVATAKIPEWVKVGTNSVYGAAIHDGWKSSRGLQPPAKPLDAWAKRKGIKGEDGRPIPGFVIARAIAKHGYKNRPKGWLFLEKSVVAAEPFLPGMLSKLGDEIRAEWER